MRWPRCAASDRRLSLFELDRRISQLACPLLRDFGHSSVRYCEYSVCCSEAGRFNVKVERPNMISFRVRNLEANGADAAVLLCEQCFELDARVFHWAFSAFGFGEAKLIKVAHESSACGARRCGERNVILGGERTNPPIVRRRPSIPFWMVAARSLSVVSLVK